MYNTRYQHETNYILKMSQFQLQNVLFRLPEDGYLYLKHVEFSRV